jgi:hypothetical protein
MAQSVLVIADSGTGKSTSIRTLEPKETFIINIANKPLPFRGYKNKYTQISKDNPKGNITSAASAAGIIKVGDIILSMDGEMIKWRLLATRVKSMKIGEVVDFIILRDGMEFPLTFTMGAMKE